MPSFDFIREPTIRQEKLYELDMQAELADR